MSTDKKQGSISNEQVMKLIHEAVGQIIEGILTSGRDKGLESFAEQKLNDLRRLEKILLVRDKIAVLLEIAFQDYAKEVIGIQDSHLGMSLKGMRIKSKNGKEDLGFVRNINFVYQDSKIEVHLTSNLQEYRMSLSELMQQFDFTD